MSAADLAFDLNARRAELTTLEAEEDDAVLAATRQRRMELGIEISDLARAHARAVKREAEEAESKARAELEQKRGIANQPLDVSAYAVRVVALYAELRTIHKALSSEVCLRNDACRDAQRLANKLGEAPMVFVRSLDRETQELRYALGRDVTANGENIAEACKMIELLVMPDFDPRPFTPTIEDLERRMGPPPKHAADSPRRSMYGGISVQPGDHVVPAIPLLPSKVPTPSGALVDNDGFELAGRALEAALDAAAEAE